MPQETYYVYTAKLFDTPQSIALTFGITVEQLYAVNPQWKNRVLIYFINGDEVILPKEIEKSPMFLLNRFLYQIKERTTEEDKKPKNYPPDWFPPKPNFGSPSSDMPLLLARLGNPKYKIGERADGKKYQRPITFTDGWADRNVSKVSIPQLKGVPIPVQKGTVKGDGNIRFYTKAHKAVQELFKAWEDDGLIPKILTFGGSYYPRTIGSSDTPSNHSFGTAFDINMVWNGQGSPPAKIGKEGCLLELVPRASELGFFWGGFYSGKKIDAMHFEYAKI